MLLDAHARCSDYRADKGKDMTSREILGSYIVTSNSSTNRTIAHLGEGEERATVFTFHVCTISTKAFLASSLFPNAGPNFRKDDIEDCLFHLPDKPVQDLCIGDITPVREWLCEHPGPDPERRDGIWRQLALLLDWDDVDGGTTLVFEGETNATYFLELMNPYPEFIPPPGTLKQDGTPFRAHPRLAPDELVDYWCGTGLGDWQGCRLVPRALMPWFFGLLQRTLTNLKALDIVSSDDLNQFETPWFVDEFTECVASIGRILGRDDYDYLAINILG
jgi:hypothetical protein